MTLTQLLVSIAILAFPMALYATELRGIPGRRPNFPLLLGSLAAHCVELETFFWLIVAPRIGRLLARWRAPRPVPGLKDRVSTEGCMSRAFWLFGPCYAVIVPLGGWGLGYRGYVSTILGLVFVLSLMASVALIPLGVIYMIGQLIRRPRSFSRPMASVGLLLLAIPCNFSFWTAVNVGWRQLEEEIGVRRLARECVGLFDSRIGLPAGSVPRDFLRTPAMSRLGPSYVQVSERNLRIELHGGFDHYGYTLNRDISNQRWELYRYGDNTPFGPGTVEPLLIWPIGSEP
jgi:hypothetical protein